MSMYVIRGRTIDGTRYVASMADSVLSNTLADAVVWREPAAAHRLASKLVKRNEGRSPDVAFGQIGVVEITQGQLDRAYARQAASEAIAAE